MLAFKLPLKDWAVAAISNTAELFLQSPPSEQVSGRPTNDLSRRSASVRLIQHGSGPDGGTALGLARK
nr:hypothetical protein Iba_chr01cCG0450 [Ipomoea batatas]